MASKSPYQGLPPERFWRTGVAEQDPLTIEKLYTRRFDLGPQDRFATAGSCFAQHIARTLRDRGCSVLDMEPPPAGLTGAAAHARGYGLYSARYGNIYTARQLLQLVREAIGREVPGDPVWEKDGRFFDAQRPGVEPQGLSSPEEVMAHRRAHLRQVRRLLKETDVLVFTLGLTEAWTDAEGGTVFPTCPGTIAGQFDPAHYAFRNFTTAEVVTDLAKVRTILQRIRPGLRLLLTVSPVPLTATMAGRHVLQATTYSKAVLRAACGELYARFEDVDYFPSYELIAAPFSRGAFYEPNLRSVRADGVASVMRVFFEAHPGLQAATPAAAGAKADGVERDRTDAEMDVMMKAFAR